MIERVIDHGTVTEIGTGEAIETEIDGKTGAEMSALAGIMMTRDAEIRSERQESRFRKLNCLKRISNGWSRKL